MSAPIERFLVVKSTVGGGLGDRIRAVLSAILYARQSGRSLHVFWDDGLYGPEGENIFHRLFELRDVKQVPIDLDRPYPSLPAFWSGELRRPMKVLYSRHGPAQWNRRQAIEQFSFDQSRLDYDEEVLVMWEFDQFGACCEPRLTWSAQAFINGLARRHLLPTEPVRTAVEAFRQAHFRPRMIGVHVRQTNETGAKAKQVEESRYHALIRRIRRRDPEAGIFLATDNREVEARFRERYGDTVVTTQKWFAPAGEPLHLAEGRSDRLANAREALLDLFLLAACDHLLYPAWSSFSMTARWFSVAPVEAIHPLARPRGVRDVLRRVRALLSFESA